MLVGVPANVLQLDQIIAIKELQEFGACWHVVYSLFIAVL